VGEAQQMTRNIADEAGPTAWIIAACKDFEIAPRLQPLEQTATLPDREAAIQGQTTESAAVSPHHAKAAIRWLAAAQIVRLPV
jgi:hypothetical protein